LQRDIRSVAQRLKSGIDAGGVWLRLSYRCLADHFTRPEGAASAGSSQPWAPRSGARWPGLPARRPPAPLLISLAAPGPIATGLHGGTSGTPPGERTSGKNA